jgi:MFS transporter, putative metabolite:H+ symporter
LMTDPATIQLPTTAPKVVRVSWLELFKYPRSLITSCLTGLVQTGSVGLTLWITTLFVLVLKVTPAEASFLVIWYGVAGVVGRFCCAWASDALGRRLSILLVGIAAAAASSLAGYWHSYYLGPLSVFFLMALAQQFFGNGIYAIVGPYMAELWPSRLRASGMGFGYGVGNLGKFIGPAGLAVIAGSSNFVSPKATLDALIPAMNYFGLWFILGGLAAWFIGFETRGRTLQQIDDHLRTRATA